MQRSTAWCSYTYSYTYTGLLSDIRKPTRGDEPTTRLGPRADDRGPPAWRRVRNGGDQGECMASRGAGACRFVYHHLCLAMCISAQVNADRAADSTYTIVTVHVA